MRAIAAMWIVGGLVALGCGPRTDSGDSPPARPDVTPDLPGPTPMPPTETTPSESAPAPPPPPSDGTDVVGPAEVGVGRKGRGYGTGPIATPLAAHWSAAERIVFNVEIPHAMNLYKALNGRLPQSHDEFMREIIKNNRINLPALPQGQRYQYDPEQEQLMVVQE